MTNAASGAFPGSFQRVREIQFFGLQTCTAPQLLLVSWLLVCTITLALVAGLLSFQGCHELGRREWEWLGDTTIKLTVLTDIQSFFLSKHSLDCCEPLAIF